MISTPNMALRSWNLATDNFNHNDLVANWDALDLHDHSEGKGVQIGTDGIQDASITQFKLGAGSVTPTALAIASVGNDRLISSTNGLNKLLNESQLRQKNSNSITTSPYFGSSPVLSGVASTNFIDIIYLDVASYSIDGMAEKLVLRAIMSTNPTAPAMTTTVGLYPITLGGGFDTIAWTAGVVHSGSEIAFASPSANTHTVSEAIFDWPMPGYYAVGFKNSATPAFNSLAAITTRLSWKHTV